MDTSKLTDKDSAQSESERRLPVVPEVSGVHFNSLVCLLNAYSLCNLTLQNLLLLAFQNRARGHLRLPVIASIGIATFTTHKSAKVMGDSPLAIIADF